MEQFWAFISAALFTLLANDPLLYGTEANTEMFMLLPLILSVLAFFSATSAEPNPRREISFAFLVGIFIGFAIAFKQVAAVHWPFLVLMYPFFAGGKKLLPRTLAFAACSAAGIAVVWATIASYFTLRHGFNDFVYNVFTHNLAYVQGVPWSRRWAYLTDTLSHIARDEIPVWIFSVIGLVSLFVARRTKEFLFFALWMLTSIAGVSASGYYFPHYFQQLLPVLCLTAALGADTIDRAALLQTSRLWLCRTAFTALLIIPVLLVLYPFEFVYTPAEASDKIYPGSHFAAKRILAEHLAQVTKPGDKVFIFGADAEILFYAQRVSATRYIFLFPLYGPYSDAKAKQIAATNEILDNNPAALVYLPNQLFFTPDSEQWFTRWAQFYKANNFQMDSCLALDPSNSVEVVTDIPNQKPEVINGLQVFGELDVRKNAAK